MRSILIILIRIKTCVVYILKDLFLLIATSLNMKLLIVNPSQLFKFACKIPMKISISTDLQKKIMKKQTKNKLEAHLDICLTTHYHTPTI